MIIELLPAVQIFADLVLFFAIIFLVRIVNKEIKKRSFAIDVDLLPEFKKLIEDSRCSADYLLQTLNEGRKSLKEIAYALDEKEKRLRFLIEEPGSKFKEMKLGNSNRGEKYEEVIKLAKQGLSEKEIAHMLNLTQGEICLILNLDRKKNENA
jgi:DNA-binding CsgD family transcriptional regulator